MWREQLPALAERYRVINVDARGHGASDPAETPFTVRDMVNDTLAALDAEGVERAVWAGLSMGGMAALHAALDVPDRVSALILLDTDAAAETFLVRLKHRALTWMLRGFGVRAVLSDVERLMFGATSRRERRELVAEWRARFEAMHVPSVLQYVPVLADREDLTPRLNEVRVPALVLVGEEDKALPPARSRRLAEALPDARLDVIPGAGHLSALERPEAVTGAMLRFLEELDA